MKNKKTGNRLRIEKWSRDRIKRSNQEIESRDRNSNFKRDQNITKGTRDPCGLGKIRGQDRSG